jgi:hypothetical protein
MLFIRVSPNRVFFVNEYWILIPLMLLIDIIVIVKVKKNRANKKLKSEELTALKMRGGYDDKVLAKLVEDYIEVNHPNCQVGKGFRYVNNERLRKIVHRLYKSKSRNGIIYITKTALCHLIEIYGLGIPFIPIIPDFIGISDWFILGKKVISVMCFGISFPMLILAQGYAPIILSLTTASFGVVIMFYAKNPGFLIVSTDPILTPISLIKRRIANQNELISVDLTSVSGSAGTKIIMPKYECSLPVQRVFNLKCSLGSSQIVEVTSNINIDLPLNYDQVVNMGDVTKLRLIKFSDQFEVTLNSKPLFHSNLRGTKRFKNRAKTSKFSEKFGDKGVILDSQEWDVTRSTLTAQDAIKIRNEDL